MKLYKNSKKS